MSRVDGDPVGAEAEKSVSQRKGRYDPGWTPTERRQRDQLMKQFTSTGGEGTRGNSEAYRRGYDAIDWSK
jgi:hypothetical protein